VLVESARTTEQLQVLLARRVAGEPLEQVVGWAEFCGLRIQVEPGVFVPRRRTEFLADRAIAAARGPSPTVVELCCGSGAVSAAVLAALPGALLHAADIDAAATRCARRNLPGAAVHLGDLYAALPPRLSGQVDVLVANAPYVPTDAVALMPPEAREHEPRVALDGGPDGLDVHRRIATSAAIWLARDGVLLIEVSAAQVPTATAIFAAAALDVEVVHSDDRDATVRLGRLHRS
jgi:release factor glutamine methyltransferase